MRSQVTRRLEFRGLSLVNKRGRSFLHRNGFPFSRCVHAITRGLSDRWNNKIPGGGGGNGVKEIFWTRVGNDCLSKKLKILRPWKFVSKRKKELLLRGVDQLFQMAFVDERSYRTLAATNDVTRKKREFEMGWELIRGSQSKCENSRKTRSLNDYFDSVKKKYENCNFYSIIRVNVIEIARKM